MAEPKLNYNYNKRFDDYSNLLQGLPNRKDIDPIRLTEALSTHIHRTLQQVGHERNLSYTQLSDLRTRFDRFANEITKLTNRQDLPETLRSALGQVRRNTELKNYNLQQQEIDKFFKDDTLKSQDVIPITKRSNILQGLNILHNNPFLTQDMRSQLFDYLTDILTDDMHEIQTKLTINHLIQLFEGGKNCFKIEDEDKRLNLELLLDDFLGAGVITTIFESFDETNELDEADAIKILNLLVDRKEIIDKDTEELREIFVAKKLKNLPSNNTYLDKVSSALLSNSLLNYEMKLQLRNYIANYFHEETLLKKINEVEEDSVARIDEDSLIQLAYLMSQVKKENLYLLDSDYRSFVNQAVSIIENVEESGHIDNDQANQLLGLMAKTFALNQTEQEKDIDTEQENEINFPIDADVNPDIKEYVRETLVDRGREGVIMDGLKNKYPNVPLASLQDQALKAYIAFVGDNFAGSKLRLIKLDEQFGLNEDQQQLLDYNTFLHNLKDAIRIDFPENSPKLTQIVMLVDKVIHDYENRRNEGLA